MKSELSPQLLLNAYSQGYFPMPQEDGDIGWYRPDPRAIIPLDGFHVSRSLARLMRKETFRISFDQNFREVMEACANHPDTWINSEFIEVYSELFEQGFAHSVEVWQDDRLVGGTYGPSIGGAFFAESMFHLETGASKIALYALVEQLKKQGFALLEVQFLTPHLSSLGAIEISDEDYMERLKHALHLTQPTFS